MNMGKVVTELSMSLDGFVAGPNDGPERPLGDGGERLVQWSKEGSPFTFVTDGVESAIRQAKQAAGDKHVAVSSANIMQQCLKAGLLDEIHIDLVPVLLGAGVRLFDDLGAAPIALERTRVIEAPGVTHLFFRVVK